jgi:Catalase
VPGIGFSPDKMLQARLFSYGDTQRYRLGVNFNHIPVNAPQCPFTSYHRDGKMRTDGNLGATPSYWPNSKGAWIDHREALMEPPLHLEGDAAHWDHRVDEDHFEQPGNPVPEDECEPAPVALRQHRPGHGRCPDGGEAPAYRELREGRPGLWQRRRRGPWHNQGSVRRVITPVPVLVRAGFMPNSPRL